MAMIAITTRSSIRVNPNLRRKLSHQFLDVFMDGLPETTFKQKSIGANAPKNTWRRANSSLVGQHWSIGKTSVDDRNWHVCTENRRQDVRAQILERPITLLILHECTVRDVDLQEESISE